MWNQVDFMKSLVIAPTLHSSNWRVFAETLAFIILGGFHRWNLGELCWISQVKSGWNPPISQVKSTRFQGEIHWISRVKSPTLHSSNWRVFAKTLAFIILGGFHRSNLGEICQISWVKSTRFQGEIPHPAFIKLKSFCWNTCFYNFGWISQVISGWNPPDFMVKSVWNPYEIRRISWNVSFCVMIKYRSFFRKTNNVFKKILTNMCFSFGVSSSRTIWISAQCIFGWVLSLSHLGPSQFLITTSRKTWKQ